MKRVFLSLFLAFVTSLCFLSPIHAQDASWVDTGYAESMSAADGGDVNSAAYISNVNSNTYFDFVRRVLGPIPGVTISASQMDTPYAQRMMQQSAVAGLSKIAYAMYTSPPASTYAFVQDMGQTLGFIPKQAYAQGIGFSGLSSLLPVWKAFRNISYGVLALVMIVIGFMVMFRKKIDPKTVVTVQNALPKVVVTLILITFSYAIVGILIDLMYIVLFAVAQLIITAVNDTNIFPADTLASVSRSNFSFVGNALWGGWQTYGDLIDFLFKGAVTSKNALLVVWGGLGYFITGVLLWLILAIAMFFASIRLFFMLLTAYIGIIKATLLGPIQILFDAFPGGSGFSDWIKDLISNLIVFPVTAICLLISQYLVRTTSTTWTPPLLGTGSGGVLPVVGLGMLFVIPSIVKGIQEKLKTKSAINTGGALGAGLGQPVQAGMQVVSFIQSRTQTKALQDLNKKNMGG